MVPQSAAVTALRLISSAKEKFSAVSSEVCAAGATRGVCRCDQIGVRRRDQIVLSCAQDVGSRGRIGNITHPRKKVLSGAQLCS